MFNESFFPYTLIFNSGKSEIVHFSRKINDLLIVVILIDPVVLYFYLVC